MSNIGADPIEAPPRVYLIFPAPIVSALGHWNKFWVAPKLLERNRELAILIDYFNHVSTEDYIAASFTLLWYMWEEDGWVGKTTCGVI